MTDRGAERDLFAGHDDREYGREDEEQASESAKEYGVVVNFED